MVALQLSASDPGNNAITYGASNLPPGLSVNTSTGLVSGTVAAGAAAGGPYQTVFSSSDGTTTSYQVVTWTVTPHVQVTAPATQSSAAGDTVSLAITASDPDNDTLQYSAAGLPGGLSINSSTGQITGTIASTASSSTPYLVTVTASDGTYSDSVRFAWQVSHVLLNVPGTQTNSTGDSVSVSLSARDNDNDTLSFSSTSLPPGLSLNSSTGAITGTLGAAGSYLVTVTVSDGHGNNTSQSFAWLVTAPLSLTNPGNQSNANGASVALSLGVVNPGGYVLSYSAVNLPAGLTINSSTGLISGTLTNTDDAGSPYSVTVTVSDGHGHSSSQSFTWMVTHLLLTSPGNQQSTEGQAVSVAVTGSDADGDTLSWSATGLASGLSINSSTGVISGTPAAGSASSTPYNVTITLSDGNGHTSSVSLLWSVAPCVAVSNPSSQSNGDGSTVSLPITADDASNGTLSFSATGLPSGLSINSSTGQISGTLASNADTNSPYTVTVTATDGTYSGSTTFTWTATPVGLFNPGTQTGAAGTAVSLGLTGSGNGTLSYSAAGLPPGLSINSSTGAITGTLANNADTNSPYSVTVTISNGINNSSQTFNWYVTPRLTLNNPGDQSNNDGDTVSLSMTATDAAGATVSYTETGLPSGLGINSSTGAITGTISNTADVNGPYSVTVTASDGTVSVSQSFTWTVSAIVSLSVPGDENNVVGDNVALAVAGSDAIGTPLTFSATGLPSGLGINAATGAITGAIGTGDDTGSPYTVTVTASDGTFNSSQSFAWTVTHFALFNPGPQSTAAGSTVFLQVSGHDADNDSLNFSATGLPSGLSINASTGAITGTISSGAAQNTPYVVVVTASDGHGNSVTQAFDWSVYQVLLVNPGDQEQADGQAVSLGLQARDASGYAVTFSAVGLPSGLTINSSTGIISGTLASNDDTSSPYSVMVTATDSHNNSSSQSFNWTVDAAPAITINDQGDQGNTDGDSVSLSLSATDPFGTLLSWSASGLPAGLTINPATGAITGTIAGGADASSPYTTMVTASDGIHSGSDTFTWTVAALSLDAPDNLVSAAGSSVFLGLQATDVSGRAVTFGAVGLPSGLTINTITGAVTGTLTPGVMGNSLVTVTASDGSSSVSQTFLWSVAEVGITIPADQTNTEGDTVSLQVQAIGPSGTSLSFSASGLPSGLSIDNSTGLISGTIAAGDAASGPYTVTVSASDGTQSSSTSFNWTVNPKVSVTAINDQTGTEGNAVLLQVQASDPGQTLTYIIDGLPAGLGINSSTGLISGTLEAGSAVAGPYAVTVTASDGTYSSSQSFNWTVLPAVTPAAPSLTNPGPQSTQAGQEVTLNIEATDPGNYPLTFSATGLPDGLTIDPYLGQITGTVAEDAVASAPYVVTVTADDGAGGASSQSFSWMVTASPLAATGAILQGVEGNNTASGTVAQFTTADTQSQAGDFLATVDWGDGYIDTGNVTGGEGSFVVSDYHVYAEPGTYAISVNIADDNGAETTAYGTAIVTDAPLSVTGDFDLGSIVNSSALVTLATFTDSNAGAPSSDYSGTINWGDNTGTQPATIGYAGNGVYDIMGSHAYAADGSYTATITLKDVDGATATTTSTLTVGNVYAGVTAQLSGFGFTDANPYATASDFQVTINWGDGSNNTIVQPQYSNGSFSIQDISHTYATDSLAQPGGVYPVTVTIQDDGGISLSASTSVVVVRPPLGLTVNGVAAGAGVAFTNVDIATLTDADVTDLSSEYSAVVNWGDGTALDSSAVITGSNGLFHILGSHNYATAGDYTIQVEVLQGWTTLLAEDNAAGPGAATGVKVTRTGPHVVLGVSKDNFKEASKTSGSVPVKKINWNRSASYWYSATLNGKGAIDERTVKVAFDEKGVAEVTTVWLEGTKTIWVSVLFLNTPAKLNMSLSFQLVGSDKVQTVVWPIIVVQLKIVEDPAPAMTNYDQTAAKGFYTPNEKKVVTLPQGRFWIPNAMPITLSPKYGKRNVIRVDTRYSMARLLPDGRLQNAQLEKSDYTSWLPYGLVSFVVTVDLIGPGAGKKDGVNQVQLGWVQDITSDMEKVFYEKGSAQRKPSGKGPWLDSGRDNAGTGGETAFTRSSTENVPAPKEQPANGKILNVISVDAPGLNFYQRNPVNGAYWTKAQGKMNFVNNLTAFSVDAKNHYDVLGQVPWSVTFNIRKRGEGGENNGSKVEIKPFDQSGYPNLWHKDYNNELLSSFTASGPVQKNQFIYSKD